MTDMETRRSREEPVEEPVIAGKRKLAPAAPASLLAGILSLAVALAGVTGIYPSTITSLIAAAALGLLGAVLGGLASKRIAARPGKLKGRPVAITGALVGVASMALVIVLMAMQGLGNAGEVYQQLG